MTIPWTHAMPAGDVTLGVGMIDPQPRGDGYPSGDILRADGSAWDRQQIVDPPSGWPKTLRPGRVDEPSEWTDGNVVASEPVRLLGHDYVVEVVTLKRIVYSDFSTYVPAKGGGLVDFRITPADPEDLEALTALVQRVEPVPVDQERIVFTAESGGKTLTRRYAKPSLMSPGILSQIVRGSPPLPPAIFALPDLDNASYALEFAGNRYPVS